MNTPRNPTRGWKLDPSNRYEFRFWTGERWTNIVSTNGIKLKDTNQKINNLQVEYRLDDYVITVEDNSPKAKTINRHKKQKYFSIKKQATIFLFVVLIIFGFYYINNQSLSAIDRVAMNFVNAFGTSNIESVCNYVVPSRQQSCVENMQIINKLKNNTTKFNVIAVVVKTIQNQNEAIVELRGRICNLLIQNGCKYQSKLFTTQSFSYLWHKAITTNNLIQCKKIKNVWYVNY